MGKYGTITFYESLDDIVSLEIDKIFEYLRISKNDMGAIYMKRAIVIAFIGKRHNISYTYQEVCSRIATRFDTGELIIRDSLNKFVNKHYFIFRKSILGKRKINVKDVINLLVEVVEKNIENNSRRYKNDRNT